MLELTEDWEYDAVGGLTLGADPVALAMLHAAAAQGRELDAFVVRKAGKAHGMQRRIEGPDVKGRRVLALDDTSTTGGSVLTAVEALREAGAEVVGVAVHRGPRHRRPASASPRPGWSTAGPTTPRTWACEPAGVAYLEAARSAVGLLARPEVADAWGRPSALAGMTVGALAVHLASEVLLVQNAWRDPARWSHDEPIPLLEHYRSSAWVTGGPDHEANVGIRESAEQAAVAGATPRCWPTCASRWPTSRGSARAPEQPAAVQMSWWEWSLSWEDFLVTRMMEIIVHSDDLAVSLDVEPPELPGAVLEPVLSLLVGVATLRHGQAAVVRALSRAERAPASIAAF